MKFVLYIILINFILFLPRYLVGLPHSWNPIRFLFSNDPVKHKLKAFYFSRIIDPFRFSFEYSLLVIVIYFMPWDKHITIIIISLLAVLIFAFNIYISVFLVLLKKTPIIKSDWFFIRESISIYKGYFIVIGLGLLFLLSLLYYGFYHLHLQLSNYHFDWVYSGIFLAFILFLGVFNIKPYNVTDYLSRSVFSLTVFITKSQKQSKTYEQLFKLTTADIIKHNYYKNIKLKKKPNIHLISMESYGSVLLRDQESYHDVKTILKEWETRIKESNIGCVSNYAVPPLFATGTWYSYSTLLFGTTIDNGALQNILFSEMANFDEYESLFQFTRRSGYKNYVLQGMIGEFDGTLDFKKLEKNLNYDYLLYNNDLEYEGQLLKFMNLQNCVPDQHTINKGLDIVKETEEPYTMFCCTLNSHWDFHSPLYPIDNWKDLAKSDTKFETTMDQNITRKERYKHSIKYTINTVFETILNRMDSNDIFIVYGDHQPTMITDEKYGKETPIHIFSHDNDFLEKWSRFGFQNSLIPKESSNKIQFEAFYSAFMKCINETYGETQEVELPFLEKGINFFNK